MQIHSVSAFSLVKTSFKRSFTIIFQLIQESFALKMKEFADGFIAYSKKKSPITPVVLLHEYFSTLKMTCDYALAAATGPMHAQTFEYRLQIKRDNEIVMESFGSGTSKSHAKHMAAHAMVTGLNGDVIGDYNNHKDETDHVAPKAPKAPRAPKAPKIVLKKNRLVDPNCCQSNSTGVLHEFCTKHRFSPPKYTEYATNEENPKRPQFGIICSVDNEYEEKGIGVSKKAAKLDASKKMIATLNNAINPDCKRIKQEPVDDNTDGYQVNPSNDILEIFQQLGINNPRSSRYMSPADLKYDVHGIHVVEQVAPPVAIAKIRSTIFNYLNTFANDLEMRLDDYLAVVSIWKQQSSLVLAIATWAEFQLKGIASQTANCPVKLNKIAIINEGRLGAIHTMPAHQDIAFTPDDPFEFSILTPLTSISPSTGALQFLPGSHRSPICPPVDMFNPNFDDDICKSDHWKKNAISIPVNAGDCIVFDSRIWYRCVGNQSNQVRFLVMTHWRRTDNIEQLPTTLPYETSFDWANKATILDVLTRGIAQLDETVDVTESEDLLFGYLLKWREILAQNQHSHLLKLCYKDAWNAVENFFIIYQTYIFHGGDSMNGEVYAKLWSSFLQPMRADLMIV